MIGRVARAGSSRGSVLVVEDEPTIAEVLARYLDRAGYEAQTAADGPAAVAAAHAGRPDLVVLDLILPGFDGLEVMRRLHADLDGRVAVIVLTARGEESDRVIGLRSGADDYVVKPFSPAELVARVDAVLRRAVPGADEACGRLGGGRGGRHRHGYPDEPARRRLQPLRPRQRRARRGRRGPRPCDLARDRRSSRRPDLAGGS